MNPSAGWPSGSHEADRLGSRAGVPRVGSSSGHVVGLVLAVCGAGLAASAAVDVLAGGTAVVALGASAVVTGAVGTALAHVARLPGRLRAGSAFGAVVSAWTAMVAVSTTVYLVTGTFGRVDDALVESVAGFTTTALSVLPRADLTSPGVLFWRASTQWFGGFAALVVIVAVLPSLGVGGVEASATGAGGRGLYLTSPRVRALLRRLLVLYLLLTGVGALLYLAGGMTPFDAVTYAFTTISTGGFGNHPRSFRHFESPLIEWLGIGGMALAGANLAMLWQALRGVTQPSNLGAVLRSAKLRAYGLLIGAASVAAAFWTMPADGPTHESVRRAAFSVVSVISTTGHTVVDWGAWPVGAQVLLMILAGVGAMSASTGGGFRVLRGLVLVGYLRREVVRQLHPRAVLAVKVGDVAVPEELASRMVGYQAVYLLVVGAGAIALALLGSDLVTSVSVALSAVATLGPALGDATPLSGGHGLAAPARLALVPVMLLGRLEVTPVLIGIAALIRVRARRGRPVVGRDA